ncbi:SIS domain-containing protein [Diplocloster agilis]|uniref:SIS domain-containing protein n=1 Tax=Diplocloster agilis TaxID=2850323 RepID=A0A949JUS6_9FIRM|nr:SIS domain-containing protein [Diplocloster agilis]MBU9735518.1 SIS domain-containing protein [Diplocloster agilis]
MYLTEKEIMSQHLALKKTREYMNGQRQELQAFFGRYPQHRFVFLGCGSSFMLAKSAQCMFGACADTSAYALAGGDYLVHPDYYKEMMQDSILVTVSRSGQTSEIVRSAAHIKERYGIPILSISMKDQNDIMPYSHMDLTMDWCYDQSVCQTRTVTNLYLALAMLLGFYRGDDQLLADLAAAVDANEEYTRRYRPVLKEIAAKNWDHAVVLADGPLNGLGEEGALAFTEIAMVPGQCFHLLDYRHGPMVLNGEHTLTVVFVQPKEGTLQADLIRDLQQRGGTLVTVSASEEPDRKEELPGVDANVEIGGYTGWIASGISFIFVCQILAFEKAMALGQNPDKPKGLDAFITLNGGNEETAGTE